MMKRYPLSFRFLCLFLLAISYFTYAVDVSAQDNDHERPVVILSAKGALTPILDEYIRRGIEIAIEERAELIILELDTPGGSIDLMNKIVQSMRSSSIPIVVYVSPRGAIAGSAGTIITLAGHLNAMAPDTAIGAASPVGSQGEDIGKTMESKTKEILKASARALAQNRSPEAVKLAEETIDSAKALSVDEALESGLIDIRASNIDDLLQQLDGRKVDMDGRITILHTVEAKQIHVKSTFIEETLLLLTNPNIVFLLLSIGVQAILIELSSPGGWIAGFIGIVCLLLAVYGLGILPINWFGFLFLILAFILFVLDIKAPTHGALTAAGAGSFIAGSLILFNSQKVPGFAQVSVPLVVGMGIFIALSFSLVLALALKAQKVPIITGRESLTGRFGTARSDISPYGQAQVGGELWSAELCEDEPDIAEGSRIEVVGVKGIHLIVRQVKKK